MHRLVFFVLVFLVYVNTDLKPVFENLEWILGKYFAEERKRQRQRRDSSGGELNDLNKEDSILSLSLLKVCSAADMALRV